jgi:FtsP/CotA-like multicopper oxidase with cupredoxin domain
MQMPKMELNGLNWFRFRFANAKNGLNWFRFRFANAKNGINWFRFRFANAKNGVTQNCAKSKLVTNTKL